MTRFHRALVWVLAAGILWLNYAGVRFAWKTGSFLAVILPLSSLFHLYAIRYFTNLKELEVYRVFWRARLDEARAEVEAATERDDIPAALAAMESYQTAFSQYRREYFIPLFGKQCVARIDKKYAKMFTKIPWQER